MQVARRREALVPLEGGDRRRGGPGVQHALVAADVEERGLPEGAEDLVEDGGQEVDRRGQRGQDRGGDAPALQDLVPLRGVGAELGVGGQDRRRVAGHVDLRDHGDGPFAGVGGDLGQVVEGVEAAVRGLVVGLRLALARGDRAGPV